MINEKVALSTKGHGSTLPAVPKRSTQISREWQSSGLQLGGREAASCE